VKRLWCAGVFIALHFEIKKKICKWHASRQHFAQDIFTGYVPMDYSLIKLQVKLGMAELLNVYCSN
jgi:hypothetical protein